MALLSTRQLNRREHTLYHAMRPSDERYLDAPVALGHAFDSSQLVSARATRHVLLDGVASLWQLVKHASVAAASSNVWQPVSLTGTVSK